MINQNCSGSASQPRPFLGQVGSEAVSRRVECPHDFVRV